MALIVQSTSEQVAAFDMRVASNFTLKARENRSKTPLGLRLMHSAQPAHNMAAAPMKAAPNIPQPTLPVAAIPEGVLVADKPLPDALSLGIGDPP
jgi:hypothetical protein